jgi:lipase chaperone LimK
MVRFCKHGSVVASQGCDRDGLSFSEKKQRLDALRADLPKLNPAQVL